MRVPFVEVAPSVLLLCSHVYGTQLEPSLGSSPPCVILLCPNLAPWFRSNSGGTGCSMHVGLQKCSRFMEQITSVLSATYNICSSEICASLATARTQTLRGCA